MINFTISTYDFDDEPEYLVHDIPRNYSYSEGKTYLVTNDDNNQDVFICRFYYLSDTLKNKTGYPNCYDYELGSVYMFSDYRGMGLSKKFLRMILENICGNIILWTQKNNEIAINLYDKIFKRVSNKCCWVKNAKQILEQKGYKDVIFFHN